MSGISPDYCSSCKHTVWPPSGRCPRCLGRTVRGILPDTGRIVGFSGDKSGRYCLVDMDGVRLVASYSGKSPADGQKVRLLRAWTEGGRSRFEVGPS
ncbi:hypothetical protein CENSYa_0586 [Cenarchaeum symbiosum A]|uniref:DUF35 domain-containing protein n=1 Tax=Cenarchaeum symbiosum (strain A) TaxID=414004 RepID=A0RV52_CENSY|nr:hypothetical protein CENSYa_0586 [Cenarchaeum symbiosum A]